MSDTNTPEIDLERLKKERSVIKGELTRFENCLNEFFTKNRSRTYLECRMPKFESILERFTSIQSEYENLLLSDFSDNYNENDQMDEREQFESRYYDAFENAKKIFDSFSNINNTPSNPSPLSPLIQAQSASSAGQTNQSVAAGSVAGQGLGQGSVLPMLTTNLPQLSIPKFYGSYGDWQRFRDMFTAIVHNNNTIADVTKFYHLESALQGETKNIIASLLPTDANYHVAWDLVKRRYENKKVLINAHLKEIIDYPNLGKESHQSLRAFLNNFLKNYRSLENLGENVANWNTILIHILSSKLDLSSKRDWEIFSKNLNSPTVDDFIKCIEQRCQLLESLDSKTYSNTSTSNIKTSSRSYVTKTESNQVFKPKCQFCKSEHSIFYCDKFKALPVSERFSQAKKLRLCTNCLRYGHKTNECRSNGCRLCQQKHATLLHQSRENNKTQESTEGQEKSSTALVANSDENNDGDASETSIANPIMANTCQNSTGSFTLLSTAIIKVQTKDKDFIPCRVLLDCASQSNFVTKDMVKKLNLKSETVCMPVIGINQIKTNLTEKVQISFSSQNNQYKNKLNFYVLPTITDFSPQTYFDTSNFDIPDEIPLADPHFNKPASIDMLLGCEIFYELLCIGQIKLGRNLPILQKTLLGWVVAGNVPCKKQKFKPNAMLSHCYFTQNKKDHFNLEQFWLVEEIASHPNSKMTKQEIECENYFVETTTRDESGRFVVKFPLKENYTELGNTEQTAINRLYAIERRLSKNSNLDNEYKAFMKEYKDLNHMTEISKNLESKTPIYYIPHHSVEKPDSTTTKLRVVFDAACKSTPNNLSLNNILKVGPTVQDDLFSLLLRFRKHNVCLIGDLAKMYRQILIDKDERNLQRIVWRDSQDRDVKHYQLNTITYGTASASYLATRCLKQISIDITDRLSAESEIIGSDFYVDDLLTGGSDLQSVLDLRKSISLILSEYGFELRKFQSNHPDVLKDINVNNQGAIKYSITDDSSVKTLGISWIPSQDVFEYNSQSISKNNSEISTKRTILSFIAKIFDPLGLLGPLSIRAKLIIQKLWVLKLDWDDEISVQLASEWQELKNEISQVGLMHIPRHVLVKNPQLIEIHGFSDASEQAYACCVFLRSIDFDGTTESHLLCAKSRVSPLKSISLARLELLGALLLSRLIVKCMESLKIHISRTYLWTDSTIVLCWILKEPKSWKTFVANRISEIQQLTKINDWNHISSEQNPADIISRGSSLKNLMNSDLWLHGPSFLVDPSKWPSNCHISNFSHTKDVPEFKVSLKIEVLPEFDIFSRYSDLFKLIRITALLLRFIHNLKNPTQKRTGIFSILEKDYSLQCLIRLAQSQSFPVDVLNLEKNQSVSQKSQLKSLSPTLDKNNIIRVGGRLTNSIELDYDGKHQVLLPAKHDLTNLIIDFEHKRTLHAGVQGTLSHIRQKYWPINGKQLVRSHIRKCVTCFRVHPHSEITPRMGDLPSARVTASKPFLHVAVDYGGPFDLKDGKTRSNKIVKGYVCMFVCLATKACHIELITDLSSGGFLAMLKRFASRRGLCTDIYSDNATNFVGSNNEIINIQSVVQNPGFETYCTETKIEWHFQPPRSPHFGGLHEAAIKSCKHHLKRVLNGVKLNYEEFYTLTCQIEAILNSRPLIPLSHDPNDLQALTPSHLLIGMPLTAVPERNLLDTKTNFVKRYRHMQQIGQHFWSRWTKEYLNHLQQRSKWSSNDKHQLKVGQLVLLKEENVPSLMWPMGRVVKIHSGHDGIARVVTVRTQNGTFKRAIVRVVALPIDV